jgi:hypothetical protein
VSAQSTAAPATALESLAVVLTGHSNVEEAVIHPARVRFGHKSHAMTSYPNRPAVASVDEACAADKPIRKLGRGLVKQTR